MRIYEFGGIDVQKELLRLHSRRSKFSITNESIEQDKEYINSFIDAANGYSIRENELVIDNFYFPITIVVNLIERKILMTVTIQKAKYVGIAGNRLEFKYETCPKSLFFLKDEYLLENEHTFIFSTKEELNQIVSLSILKFRDIDVWNFLAFGYDSSGDFHRITNI